MRNPRCRTLPGIISFERQNSRRITCGRISVNIRNRTLATTTTGRLFQNYGRFSNIDTIDSAIHSSSIDSTRKTALNFTSNFSTKKDTKHERQRGFVPRKAAVKLSDSARRFCKLLLKNAPDDEVMGIMLKYQMSTAGQMKMVFAFEFVRPADIGPDDEGVSLELLDDGSPKPPSESEHDGLPKLYIHHTAFMKVLGGTLDVDIKKDGSFTPILYDREGNLLDPNA